jgi:anti-sigma factor RsiW
VDWNCTLTEERLSDYLEGQLSAAESAAFAAHRERCERCTGLVGQVRELLADMHRLEAVEAPPHLQTRVLDATLGPRTKKEGWRRWVAWTPMIWRPRFAIGLATVTACALIVIQAGGVLPTRMHKANVNPADIVRSINRQAHLTYAQGVRFVNNLRVVYEIESRLDNQNPQPAAQRQRNQMQPNQNDPQEKSDKRGRSQSRDAMVYAETDGTPAAEPADAAPATDEFSFHSSPAQIHAAISQQRFETHLDRRRGQGNLFADTASGDPNRNQGFPAADRSAGS